MHSNKKRRQVVLSAPNLATFQAWQLSLWYQELALLYLLNHQGEYRNRLTASAWDVGLKGAQPLFGHEQVVPADKAGQVQARGVSRGSRYRWNNRCLRGRRGRR